MTPFLPAPAGMLLVLFAAGCNTTPQRVQVTPSNLNYASVTYANTNLVVKMEFSGTGYCTMRKGADAGLTNVFSQHAHEARETRLEFSAEEMIVIFQSLVNTGIFEKEPKNKEALALPYVSMMGRIENTGFHRVSKTPEFLEMAAWMMDLFEEAEQQRLNLR